MNNKDRPKSDIFKKPDNNLFFGIVLALLIIASSIPRYGSERRPLLDFGTETEQVEE